MQIILNFDTAYIDGPTFSCLSCEELQTELSKLRNKEVTTRIKDVLHVTIKRTD